MVVTEKSKGKNRSVRMFIPYTTGLAFLPYDGGMMDQPYRMMEFFNHFIQGDRLAFDSKINQS